MWVRLEWDIFGWDCGVGICVGEVVGICVGEFVRWGYVRVKLWRWGYMWVRLWGLCGDICVVCGYM